MFCPRSLTCLAEYFGSARIWTQGDILSGIISICDAAGLGFVCCTGQHDSRNAHQSTDIYSLFQQIPIEHEIRLLLVVRV